MAARVLPEDVGCFEQSGHSRCELRGIRRVDDAVVVHQHVVVENNGRLSDSAGEDETTGCQIKGKLPCRANISDEVVRLRGETHVYGLQMPGEFRKRHAAEEVQPVLDSQMGGAVAQSRDARAVANHDPVHSVVIEQVQHLHQVPSVTCSESLTPHRRADDADRERAFQT